MPEDIRHLLTVAHDIEDIAALELPDDETNIDLESYECATVQS